MLELKYWTRSETYTLIGAAVFYLICYGLSKALSPRLFSSYNKLPRAQRSEWNSRVVSDINALICIVMAPLALMDMPDWKLESHSSYANVSHAVIAGYFLYDMLVMLLHPDLLDKGSLAHHVVGLIAFPGLMNLRVGEALLTMFVATEFTTPFINQRWFFEKSDMKTSKAYLANGLLIWVFWVLVRVPMILVPPYFLVPETKVLLAHGYIVFALVWSLWAAISFLNAWWFYLITRGILKALSGGGKPSDRSTGKGEPRGNQKGALVERDESVRQRSSKPAAVKASQ